jgi:hypothetical protein
MADFATDKAFEERFRGHLSQIVARLVTVSVAPPEEDWKHNTDYGLTIDVPTAISDNGVWRVSARIRRAEQKAKRGHQTGHPFTREFTVRHSRPSGIATERDKLFAGHGALFIYGFESEPGSDQLDPWIILGLDKLRAWDTQGRKHRSIHQNKDRSSSLAVYWLEDIPRDAVLRSGGIPRQVAGSYESAKTDRRFIPYTRPDNWAESSNVHPDTSSTEGWLCPQCGANALKFYGLSPQYDPPTRRYVGPDTRVCQQCYSKAA